MRTLSAAQALCLVAPDGSAWLASHPPLRQRLDRLARMQRTMGRLS